MLQCLALRKTYRSPNGAVEAVRGIDCTIARGEYAAVIGRSGSGKSSLMAMVGGLSRPSGGQVLVDGTDIWSLGEVAMAAFRNCYIGFVFQFASLIKTLNTIDNVALPALLGRTCRPTEAYDRAAELLSEVGLSSHRDALPSELSSGEQRRVAIARALINKPLMLLADEPTSDLDEQTEREVMSLLRQISDARETTLLLVTHSLTLAGEAGQVIHVADGVIVP